MAADAPSRAKYRAAHRAKLISAAKAGDPEAGRAMLTHAVTALRNAIPADEADRLALDWVREALRLATADGVALERAFGVERVRGRPRRHPLADVVEAALIAPEVEELTAKFAASGDPAPKRTAVQKVAQRLGVSATEIRRVLSSGTPARRGVPDAE